MKTKTTAWLMALVILLSLPVSLSGCADEGQIVMRYGDSVITDYVYRYWLSTYKGSFLDTYTDMTNTDAFYDSVLYDDVTAEEYLNESVKKNVMRNLLCTELFDTFGLSFPKTAEETVDAYIEELITQRADGSRKAFNQMLAEYGINIRMLKEIYINEDKTALLFEHLYGEGGERALKAEDLQQYCEENYVRVRHIYVNNAYVYELDENGYYRYDTSGQVMTRDLTAEEKAEKQAKIDAIEGELGAGARFEDVYAAYSEDQYYENGYYLTYTTSFIPEVVNAAMALETGEGIRVDTEHGVHFLLRLEMDDTPYEKEENADFFGNFEKEAENAAFIEYLDALMPEIEVDEETLGEFSIRDAAVNYFI